jgi:hypothetical protein
MPPVEPAWRRIPRPCRHHVLPAPGGRPGRLVCSIPHGGRWPGYVDHQYRDELRLPGHLRVGAAVDLLNADAAACNSSMSGFLCPHEGTAPWLRGRHEHLDRIKPAGQAAESLPSLAARGQGVGGRLGHPLVMAATCLGVAEAEARERGMAQRDEANQQSVLGSGQRTVGVGRIPPGRARQNG